MAAKTIPFTQWKPSVLGRGIDRDGSGVPLAQCWDLWADYAERVLGVPLGWTFTLNRPGDAEHFLASSVYTRFPTPREGDLGKFFVKLGRDAAVQAGDVLFWRDSPKFRGSHVAIADGPNEPGGPWTITQNPGNARRERIPLGAEYLGALRPLENIGGDVSLEDALGRGEMFILFLQKKHTYLVLPNAAAANPNSKGDAAKPFRATLLGNEAAVATGNAPKGAVVVNAHSADFTLKPLSVLVGGINPKHLTPVK